MKRDSDLALKDSYPLLYSSKTKISKNKDAEYNAKGFGAGGLLPLTFSHLSRNWKTSGQYTRTLEDSATARREIGRVCVAYVCVFFGSIKVCHFVKIQF